MFIKILALLHLCVCSAAFGIRPRTPQCSVVSRATPTSSNGISEEEESSGSSPLQSFANQHKPQLLKQIDDLKLSRRADAQVLDFLKSLHETGSVQAAKAQSGGIIPYPKISLPEISGQSVAQKDSEGLKLNSAEVIKDFVEYFENIAGGRKNNLVFTADEIGTFESPFRWSGSTPERFQNYLENLKLNSSHSIDVRWLDSGGIGLFTTFDKTRIDLLMGKKAQNVTMLEETLGVAAYPLLVPSAYLQPNPSFVSTSPADFASRFPSEDQQLDKSFAVVVAGESGSGKSVFACQAAKALEFTPLYVHVKGDEIKNRPVSEQKKWEQLQKLVMLAIDEISEDEDEDSKDEDKDHLYTINSLFNWNRDRWAENILVELVQGVVPVNDVDYKGWVQGNWPQSKRPNKVAIVVDEATDIELAEGLVSRVRAIHARYFRLAAQQVLLVIAGVGLDVIKHGTKVGTNPSQSRLVVMKTPNVEEIVAGLPKNKTQAIRGALDGGFYARVLKTNARMLFRSVLPELQRERHYVDEDMEQDSKEARTQQRLIDIASYRAVMDHAARYYVGQNSIGDLCATDKESLLCQAFIYHMVEALEASKYRGKKKPMLRRNHLRELELVRDMQSEEKLPEIFSKGLVSQDGTSTALKYLACFGLACQLRPSDGPGFEELAMLHVMRRARVEGFFTAMHKLKHSWPPAKHGNDTAEEIKKLSATLADQTESFKGLTLPKDADRVCVVFEQGGPTAQGADFFALLVDCQNKEAQLEAYQCKHINPKNKGGPKDWVKWWSSLGVDLSAPAGSEMMCPATDSAGYSYKGLDGFKNHLERTVQDKFGIEKLKLGYRTMACSFSPWPRADRPLPEDGARVWFREHFEPTISVFPPPDLDEMM